MIKLEDYIPVVGQSVIDDLRLISENLRGKVVQNINSTPVGGGVAEILNRMVPLLKEMGIDARWDVIKGGKQFFEVTKKFHNALHGKPEEITSYDFEVFMETGRANLEELDTYGDIVFVHDPQPITLVQKRAENRWVWRCHIDVSHPNMEVWNFLKDFIVRYDASVFSAPGFSQPLPIRQFLISPSIDPLSDKNKELPESEIKKVMQKYDILG